MSKYLWGRNNPFKFRIIQKRRHAKKRGHEFTLEYTDVDWVAVCPVLGIELDYSIFTGKKAPLPNAPSIDRIDNSKGYIPGNVRVISYRANRLKSDMTLQEARLLVKDLESYER